MRTSTVERPGSGPRGQGQLSRKLFSFFGVVPLGIYVVWHLANNFLSVSGPAAFDARLARINASPLYAPVVWICVYVPFLVHAIIGVLIAARGKVNVVRLPWFRNWKYLLQRVTALGVLLFVPAHVYKTKIEPWTHAYTINFAHMREGMLEPLTFSVYVLAMLGVAFHLANGIWLAGLTWGVFVGRKAQRLWEWVSIVFGIVLLVLAFGALWGLRSQRWSSRATPRTSPRISAPSDTTASARKT